MEKIIFTTNLDLCNEEWPTELPRIPIVGEIIQSKTIHKSSKRLHAFCLTLQVVRVTWKYYTTINSWIPEVELHVTDLWKNKTLKDFYEWYAPLVGKRVSWFL